MGGGGNASGDAAAPNDPPAAVPSVPAKGVICATTHPPSQAFPAERASCPSDSAGSASMMASRLAPSGTDRNDSTGHPSENARSAAEAEASNDADAGADDAARDASSMLKASGPLTAPARVTRRTAKGETDRDASSSMTSGAGTVGAEVLQLRLLHDLARRGTALTPAQAERAAALIRIVAERNPGALLDTGVDGLGLAPPPKPTLAPGLDKLPIKQRLRAVQSFIFSLQYNHTGEQYFSINKQRPLGRVMDTAKQIMRDALPIKCVEAVFLALHLTMGWREVDRIPVSFKTQVAGKHVHRHIVLLVRCKETGNWGALGISRRKELACKELEHTSITSVLTSFKQAYETWWHAILKVRLGLPVDHDPLSLTPICWRHCCITVAGKTWEEACRGFEEQSARSKKLYEKWKMDGERYRPTYADKQPPARPWQAAAEELRRRGPEHGGGTGSGGGCGSGARTDRPAGGRTVKGAVKGQGSGGGAATARAGRVGESAPARGGDGKGAGGTAAPKECVKQAVRRPSEARAPRQPSADAAGKSGGGGERAGEGAVVHRSEAERKSFGDAESALSEARAVGETTAASAEAADDSVGSAVRGEETAMCGDLDTNGPPNYSTPEAVDSAETEGDGAETVGSGAVADPSSEAAANTAGDGTPPTVAVPKPKPSPTKPRSAAQARLEAIYKNAAGSPRKNRKAAGK